MTNAAPAESRNEEEGRERRAKKRNRAEREGPILDREGVGQRYYANLRNGVKRKVCKIGQETLGRVWHALTKPQTTNKTKTSGKDKPKKGSGRLDERVIKHGRASAQITRLRMGPGWMVAERVWRT